MAFRGTISFALQNLSTCGNLLHPYFHTVVPVRGRRTAWSVACVVGRVLLSCFASSFATGLFCFCIHRHYRRTPRPRSISFWSSRVATSLLLSPLADVRYHFRLREMIGIAPQINPHTGFLRILCCAILPLSVGELVLCSFRRKLDSNTAIPCLLLDGTVLFFNHNILF